MSIRLLIDEDAQDKLLVKLLRDAGHEVTTANDAGLMGQPDRTILDYAKSTNRVLLTLNCRDFQALHAADPNHPGILAVYQDANPLKRMRFRAIVEAMAHLEAAQVLLTNQFIALKPLELLTSPLPIN